MCIPRAIILLSVQMLFAFYTNGQSTMFQDWYARETLTLDVATQWDTLFSIRDDRDVEGTLADGVNTLEIKMRLRGVSRRRDCIYKPFQLNLKKKDMRKRGYEEFDKFKVVTHCIEFEDGEENVYEELLIYHLYNAITDESYRAKLCNFNYIDATDETKPLEAIAIILEPNDECFWRLNGEEVEMFNFPKDSMEGYSYVRTAMFQFMIGNLDWGTDMMQNVKFVRRQNGLSTIIPYDFDYSAIVAPPYARLNPDVGQTDFRDRYYRGAYFEELIPEILSEFIAKRDDILGVVDNFEYLKSSRRKWLIKYFEAFFEYLENPETAIGFNTILTYK